MEALSEDAVYYDEEDALQNCTNPKCHYWWHGLPTATGGALCPGSHLFDKKGKRLDRVGGSTR